MDLQILSYEGKKFLTIQGNQVAYIVKRDADKLLLIDIEKTVLALLMAGF